MSLHHSPDKNYLIHIEKYTGTGIVFGEGAFPQLAAHLLLERADRASFVFGGKSSAMDSGLYKSFTHMISGFDIDAPTVTDVPPEPSCGDVRRIVDFFKEQNPNVVVAAGGGSVMDAAKAAYLSWQSGLDVSELFGVDVVSKAFPGKEFKQVICIPTTAGTGSEVTPYSNIVDNDKGVKRLIMERLIAPKLAFVDPLFTMTMSRSLTIATALDALVHNIESFLNTNAPAADPASDDWAVESAHLIRFALPRVLENPRDLLAREMLSAASVMGGMCIRCRPTSLPHLCSFSMTGKMPHGIAVAAFLIPFWRYYLAEESVRRQTMRLAGIFDSGSPCGTPESVVDACEAFLLEITGGFPAISSETIDKIASDALCNPMKLASAPRVIPPASAQSVLRDILSGAFAK